MKIEWIMKALKRWQNKDNDNRCVILIASDKNEGTVKGSIRGMKAHLAQSYKSCMDSPNSDLAEIAKIAEQAAEKVKSETNDTNIN